MTAACRSVQGQRGNAMTKTKINWADMTPEERRMANIMADVVDERISRGQLSLRFERHSPRRVVGV